MTELAEFYAARLDERERIALAASSEHRRQATKPEHWQWECAEDDEPLDVDLAIASNDELLKHGDDHYRIGLRSIEEYPSSVGMLCHLVIDGEEVAPQVARHLAYWDPAQALREVEAGRKILALHKPDRNPADQWYGNDVRCEECGGITGSPAMGGERGFNRSWPCQTLRAAISAFSGHPGYKPEWKP